MGACSNIVAEELAMKNRCSSAVLLKAAITVDGIRVAVYDNSIGIAFGIPATVIKQHIGAASTEIGHERAGGEIQHTSW